MVSEKSSAHKLAFRARLRERLWRRPRRARRHSATSVTTCRPATCPPPSRRRRSRLTPARSARALSARRVFSPRVRRSSRVATPSRASATAPPEEPPLPLFEGPECWRGPDLMRFPESWTHVLTSDEVAELDAALARARASNLDVIDLTPETFPLPLLAPASARFARSSSPAEASTSSRASPCTATTGGRCAPPSTAWARTSAGRARRTPRATSSVTSRTSAPTRTTRPPEYTPRARRSPSTRTARISSGCSASPTAPRAGRAKW